MLTMLVGCSAVPEKAPPTVAQDETKQVTSEAPKVVISKIDEASLYDILLAEIAARRDRADVASQRMFDAAQRTKNTDLAERSAHMAHYFKDFDTLNRAADLWHTLAPNENRATLLQSAALTQQGKFIEAFETLLIAFKNQQDANFPALASAATKASTEQQQALLLAINNSLLNYPDELQLLISRAILLDGLSQPENALSASDQVLRQDPDNYPALHIKTRSLQLLSRSLEAIDVLEKTLDIYPEASNLRLHLARILTESNLAEASMHFGILVDQFPNEGRYRLSYALTLKQLNNFQEAIEQLNTLLEQQQLQSEASYYLAVLYRNNSHELASQLCQDVARDSAYFLPAHSLYLDIMSDNSQLPEAITYFKNLQTPADTIAVKLSLLLSQKLTEQHLYSEAVQYLQQSIDVLGSDNELLYQLALLDTQLGFHQKAQHGFETILGQNPNHTGALNALGFLLAEQNKQLDRAEQLVTLALKQRPDDAAIIDSLGWILYKKGLHQEAAAYLAKAHQLLKDPEIASHYIETLWQLNRRIEASDIAKDALQRFPQHPLLIDTVLRFNIPARSGQQP